MAEHAQRLLEDIRKEAEASLDPAMTRAVLDEIAAHLDASIQARMELGDSVDQAERDAVAEFGSARVLVRGLMPLRCSSWFDLRFFTRVGLAALLVFLGGYFGWHLTSPDTATWIVAPCILLFLTVTVRESTRARRPQTVPILAIFACVSFLGAAGEARYSIPDGAMDRALATNAVANLHQMVAINRQRITEYDAKRQEFLRGSSIAPIAVLKPRVDDYHFESVTRTEGARLWDHWDTHWRAKIDDRLAQSSRDARHLQELLARPWILDTFSWLPVAAVETFYAVVLVGFVNLLVCSLAAAIRLARRLRTST
jgi:hypothetical protein